MTFKGLIKSSLNYAAPIWGPNASSSSFKKLQVIQNAALRVATGCHASTPLPLLHQEMAEMPVEAHVHMLGAQFLASAMRQDHPSFHLASADPGPRQMKETLRSKYIGSVEPLLVNVIPELLYVLRCYRKVAGLSLCARLL